MSFIKPILTNTLVVNGNPECRHEDITHLEINRSNSGDTTRPWLAIEKGTCKTCGGRISKFWLTTYKDYAEGARALST